MNTCAAVISTESLVVREISTSLIVQGTVRNSGRGPGLDGALINKGFQPE